MSCCKIKLELIIYGVAPSSPFSHYIIGFLQRLSRYQHRPLELVSHLAVLVLVEFVLCSFRNIPKAFRESRFYPRAQEGDSALPENDDPNTVSVPCLSMVKMV